MNLKSFLWSAMSLLAASIFCSSCDKTSDNLDLLAGSTLAEPKTNIFAQSSSGCNTEQVTYTIFGGQNIEVGQLVVNNDADNLYVTYRLNGCWQLAETHLYVGAASGIPVNRSNVPVPGQFPHSNEHADGTTSYTYTIPLSGLPACYAIAAHSSVVCMDNGNEVQQETGWSFGTAFPNSNRWGWYSEYCTQACCVYETERYDIFGGQTIPVGQLLVTNDNDNLYVTYSLTGTWQLAETHLYVGNITAMPINRSNIPIPGQFPYSSQHVAGSRTYTYTVPLRGLPPCYAISAHASVVSVNGGIIMQQETAWSFGTVFPNSRRWGWYSSYCTQQCN